MLREALFLLSATLALAFLQPEAAAQEPHILPLQFGAPVIGEPFSATRTLDYEPAQNSSDPIAFHAEEEIVRDSAGRTRSEFKYADRLATVNIIDFVAHRHCRWTVGDTVASCGSFPVVPPQGKSSETPSTDDPLIEGVPVRHSRSVIGKDKIEKTVESWYSPELRLAMLTIIDQPGIGKTTYRFIHVKRAEPDAALLRVPDGFTIDDAQNAPPPPVAGIAPQSTVQQGSIKPALPYAIRDDNYLEALARFHAAVPRWLPLESSYHRHTDLRIIDVFDHESAATVDHWQKSRLGRDEEQATSYHYAVVWGLQQNWAIREGIPPLRLFDLSDLTPRPGAAERRIRMYAHGYVAMTAKSVHGTPSNCSGVYAGAEICFETATGFPVSALVDEEEVVYEQWAQYRGASYPARMALYRKGRLQMKTTTTVTPLGDADNELFQPPPGVTPTSNRLGAYREDQHKILSQGQLNTSVYGEALVKVSVDESGKVRQVDLLDADDKSLGSAAVKAAKQNVYLPEEINGKRVPFQATFLTSHWSTVDPLRIPATSRQSQGTD